MRRRIGRIAPVAGRVLLWTAIAVLGALTGLRLAGPIDQDTALGEIRLRIQASWTGEVDAYVPLADWLPFRYQLALPVELMTGRHTEPAEVLRLLAAQAGWVVFMGLACRVMWRRGLARFGAYGG